MGGLPGRLDPGERAVKFINNLTLSDDFQGQPFRLRPWQAEIPRKLFGTLLPSGLRQYRRCLLLLPRKQAKTQLSAAIAVYCILGSGLKGQSILLAASDREQASHLYDKAVEMIEADKFLKRRCNIFESKKTIVTKKGRNKLKVLSADGRRQHGQNPSIVILDEVHTQPNRKLHDALSTAFAARREPLMILISTAGNETGTLIHDEYIYACKVRDGKEIDPTYLPIIYEASPDDDWTSEATWAKAMPAIGDFVSYDHFRNLITRAKADPSEEAVFKQFYLNLWVASATKWLNREGWNLCGTHAVVAPTLQGKRCFGGLDVSNTSDITAYVLDFPMPDGSHKLLSWFWIPEEYAKKHNGRGGNKYLEWAKAGYITLTPGWYIKHELIMDKILELKKLYKIEKTFVDPWNSKQISMKLIEKKMVVEEFRQHFGTMNEPVKDIGVLIGNEQLHHGDNPVLNWMAENAVTLRDSQGNIRFDKESSADKIDGMVCIAMARAGSMVDRPKPKPSIIFA